MKARLFLALWPDAAVRAQLAQWRDSVAWPRCATPVRCEQLHLTLHFIGDVDEQRIEALAAQLDVAGTAFTLAFGSAVLWPQGIAVLEPVSTPHALSALHGALGERLLTLGLPVASRSYQPHVTLARRAGGAGAAAAAAAGPAITWAASSYALVRSHSGHGGGYEMVRQFAF